MKPTLVLPIVLALAHAASARAAVRHVPPADATAGAPLELVAEAPSTTPALVAHVRPTGGGAYRAIELVRRDDAHWVAIVPGSLVVEPGLDYYLDAGGQPVFATPEWPHTLPVHVDDVTARRELDSARSHARRSRLHVMGEWVDYGSTVVGNQRLADDYYRVDADFSYRLWAYPLEEIRVGYTRLLGDTPGQMCPSAAPCTEQAGFKVGGWFELGLAPVDGVHFDGRAMVMATQAGFAIGGRAEARLGDRDGSHVALGAEHLADVGTAGYFRLGWGTVPRLPMAATVEITNMPASFRATGVRLYYDIARDFGDGVRLAVRVGYAARVEQVAGITGGAGLTVDF